MDVFADMIQLLESRRLYQVKNIRQLKLAFDFRVNELFRDQDAECTLDLHKLSEICCASERLSNQKMLLQRITTAMNDPTQIKSTRRITKILSKVTQNPDSLMANTFFIERCARDLDLDAIQQTTPVIQSQLLKHFSIYTRNCIA